MYRGLCVGILVCFREKEREKEFRLTPRGVGMCMWNVCNHLIQVNPRVNKDGRTRNAVLFFTRKESANYLTTHRGRFEYGPTFLKVSLVHFFFLAEVSNTRVGGNGGSRKADFYSHLPVSTLSLHSLLLR